MCCKGESCTSDFGGIRDCTIKDERQFETPGRMCIDFSHAENWVLQGY